MPCKKKKKKKFIRFLFFLFITHELCQGAHSSVYCIKCDISFSPYIDVLCSAYIICWIQELASLYFVYGSEHQRDFYGAYGLIWFSTARHLSHTADSWMVTAVLGTTKQTQAPSAPINLWAGTGRCKSWHDNSLIHSNAVQTWLTLFHVTYHILSTCKGY